jgi:DNA-binding CsgD family transcriptional regulator
MQLTFTENPLHKGVSTRPPRLSLELTRSEREIARRIVQGQSAKEIAVSLFRSIETIQNHRKAIKAKLGISGGKFALLNYLKDCDDWCQTCTT